MTRIREFAATFPALLLTAFVVGLACLICWLEGEEFLDRSDRP
jgi:hypothetical protein